MTTLVIDVGTSSVRALAVRPDGATTHEHHVETLPTSPHPGLVEFDPTVIVRAARDVAARVIDAAGPVDAVGIANQRASTVLWDARTGEPLGPGLGWQDLRTVGRCLELRAEGVEVAPNTSATKMEWLIAQTDIAHEYLRVGTVDTWLAWHLTADTLHVTDATNALVTGLHDVAGGGWDAGLCERLGIPVDALPTIVDSLGVVGAADLPGAPPLAALIGDQQASLIGQGCIHAGMAKITFGTGGMLDLCLGDTPPQPTHGTFPIIAWQSGDRTVWGLEAVMLSAGTSVEWLRDGLGIIDSAESSAEVAASVDDADGVVFVPSLSGTGTPVWDHGARGLLLGVTRGTTRAHVVRAVLEGIAHRGADLVEAAEAASGMIIDRLRIDGGMSRNPVFCQALADAAARPVDVSPEREATALGAGLLAGVATGVWVDLEEATATALGDEGAAGYEPQRVTDRDRFAEARDRAGGWIPALSELDL
ncbi:MAG: FGGY family carbohydrate kinase [Acidimicrobiales bacterium]